MISITSSNTLTVSETFENILEYTNIIDYKYCHCSPVLELNTGPMIIQNTTNDYYFVFDGPGQDALAHWIFESFIFYPIFLQLKQKYKSIKIITKNTKKYVKNLFKLFEIDCEIIHCIPDNTNKNNVYFFPPVLSLNDKEINQTIYIYFVNKYREYIIENTLITFIQQINILFLPRNVIDNYTPNDRKNPYTTEIKEYVINNGGVTLNTYDINNLFLQFNTINNSGIIILDFGSSFLFNCIFVKNKKIILLTDGTLY